MDGRAGFETSLVPRSLERELADLRAYRAAIDHHAIVAVTDRSGRITAVNDLFCRISKYSRDELLGQNHRILNSGHHPKRFWVDVWRQIARGQVWHGEVCNRARDGTLYWVDTTIVPIADDMGKIVQYVAIRADITGRKQAEEALRTAKNAAEVANTAKSEFLANMSHEIRTPMTAILGYAGLLNDARDDRARQIEYIDVIRRNGEHLLSIINDILDIAKIEAGKLAIEAIKVSPAKILQEVLEFKRVRLIGRSIELLTKQLSPVPEVVYSDPTRLKQILMNLAGNAIKFTDSGHVAVSVGYEQEGPEEGSLILQIADTGVGMSQEQLQRLFGAFEQADASTSRKYGGTGLGLRISRRLAQMLGGSIDVASDPGVGSRFTVRIPARRPLGTPLINVFEEASQQGGSLGSTDSMPSSGSNGDQALAGKRILVAEDGVDNQRLIRQLLTRAGAEVVVVANGRLAIEALSCGGTFDGELLDPPPFDLLLTDIQMPVLDGYATARLLRERGSRLRIIALTAHAMDGDGERCIAAGCDAYATKPIDRRTLVSLCAKNPARTSQINGNQGPVLSEFADDPDYVPLVAEFIEAMPQRLEELQAALDVSDFSRVTSLAHQLKGAGGGYGFPEVTKVALALEQAARHGPAAATEVRAILGTLGQLIARMAAGLRAGDSGARLVVIEAATDKKFGANPAHAVQGADSTPQVLVIDDAVDVYGLLRQELGSLAVRIQLAATGCEGLRCLADERPELVLLDLDLPDMGGLDVLRKLRQLPGCANLPVIVLTGSEDEDSLLQAFECGATDYVRKPFRGPELRARVQTALRTQGLMMALECQVTLDPLTGLLNRGALVRHLNDALRRQSLDADSHGAVLFLDFDRFKQLNDLHGHEAGDAVLRQIARRLADAVALEAQEQALASPIVVGRLGGDEFAVVLEGARSAESATRLARCLLGALAMQVEADGQRLYATASVGVAHLPSGGTWKAEQIMGQADKAMYEAKRSGGARFCIFDDSMRTTMERRKLIERDLHTALLEEQLVLQYQPIVSLRTGRAQGLEALVRWDHPQQGRLGPGEFLPVAVESGLIRALGDWVMRTACAQLAELRSSLGERAPEYVAVNVSRRQLSDPKLPARVTSALESAALAPERLLLELTESELVHDQSEARNMVNTLKALGVKVVIDDFGTGYSSLSSLHEYPVDVVKLDRSFLNDIDVGGEHGRQLFAIAHSIVRLAQNLGMGVVAEGVETPAQLALLYSLDCELAQGYLFGRPMDADKIEDYCRSVEPMALAGGSAAAQCR